MWSDLNPPKHIGPAVATHGDDRKGLGYGQLKARFHKNRQLADTFPYTEDDQLEDEDDFEMGEESQAAIASKTQYLQQNDPYAFKSANRMYYAGASTQLAACFSHSDEILIEIGKVGKGMVPIPGLYKSFDGPAVGGFSTAPASFKVGPAKRTGTERGWASIPPESKIAVEIEYEEDDEPEEFYSLENLADLQRPTLGECFQFMSHT